MSDLVPAFVNEKTNKVYKVKSFDPEKGEVTLIGEQGIAFTEKYDKEAFVRMGYSLKQVPAA